MYLNATLVSIYTFFKKNKKQPKLKIGNTASVRDDICVAVALFCTESLIADYFSLNSDKSDQGDALHFLKKPLSLEHFNTDK